MTKTETPSTFWFNLDGIAVPLSVFFRKLLKGQGQGPNRLITDKLKSYGCAHREIMPTVPHDTRRWANNRAEVSHEAVRFRERQMRRFKSPGHAQRFLSVHGVVGNLFRGWSSEGQRSELQASPRSGVWYVAHRDSGCLMAESSSSSSAGLS